MTKYLYECEMCEDSCKTVRHQMSENPVILCDNCLNPMYRVITGGQKFIIKEENCAESTKPDSYFANAEWNRKQNQKKKRKMAREKLRDKDKETMDKLHNKISNMERVGKEEESAKLIQQIDKL